MKSVSSADCWFNANRQLFVLSTNSKWNTLHGAPPTQHQWLMQPTATASPKKLPSIVSSEVNLIECEVLIAKSLPMVLRWSHRCRGAMIVFSSLLFSLQFSPSAKRVQFIWIRRLLRFVNASECIQFSRRTKFTSHLSSLQSTIYTTHCVIAALALAPSHSCTPFCCTRYTLSFAGKWQPTRK